MNAQLIMSVLFHISSNILLIIMVQNLKSNSECLFYKKYDPIQ